MYCTIVSYESNLCSRITRQSIQTWFDSLCHNLQNIMWYITDSDRYDFLMVQMSLIYHISYYFKQLFWKCQLSNSYHHKKHFLYYNFNSWNTVIIRSITFHIYFYKLCTSSTPLLAADNDTSMRKKYSGGIGGRTIYSAGAINSILPFKSSGRWSKSTLLPLASKCAKYSPWTGHKKFKINQCMKLEKWQ